MITEITKKARIEPDVYTQLRVTPTAADYRLHC